MEWLERHTCGPHIKAATDSFGYPIQAMRETSGSLSLMIWSREHVRLIAPRKCKSESHFEAEFKDSRDSLLYMLPAWGPNTRGRHVKTDVHHRHRLPVMKKVCFCKSPLLH